MTFWIIPLTLFVVSFIVIVVMLFKKIPQLRVVDLGNVAKEKVKEIKDQIILDRLKLLKWIRF